MTDFLQFLSENHSESKVANTVDLILSLNEVDDRISEFKEDPLVKEAFEKGLDLREYSKTIERELELIENCHVLDYVINTNKFTTLASQILECDAILSDMGEFLTVFQEDLLKISMEIESLQMRSSLLTTRLKNRVDLESILHTTLDGLVVSPDLIKKICEGEVNEFFLTHLSEINKKMTYVKGHHQAQNIKALKEVGPELERLRLKATEKIRDFLLKKIDSLKSPNTNINIIQQNIFLKFKELFWFLIERYSEAATEIKVCYVNTVSLYYSTSFEKYLKSTVKLQMVIADKMDLIGLEENTKRSSNIFSSKVNTLKDKSNVYSLGERIQILTNPDPGIILTHISEEQNLKYPYEVIFKSLHRLLMDNASSEYIFSTLFFVSPTAKQEKSDFSIATLVFNETFDSTIKLLYANIKQLTESNFDAVGILLCIRLNNQFLKILQKRRIPCLDQYLNGVNMILWPKYQAIIDLHIDSLKRANPTRLVGAKDNTNPHFITRRYGEFAASILTLNQGYEDALLTNSLLRLRGEVEALLFRMSGELTDRKGRVIFLINNYDLVLNILSEHNFSSLENEKSHFTDILEKKTGEYILEELRPQFANLISFITFTESEKKLLSIDQAKFEKIALEFNNSWKASINQLNSSVIQSFPNFQNGARVLHSVLTQLLVYYKRFLTVWEQRFVGVKKAQVYPVGLQAVMVEIKKFKSLDF